MAVPTGGKCIVAILLVLVLYAGDAFRIRDAATQQTAGGVEKSSRLSNVCGSSTLGKCAGDAQQRVEQPSTLAPLKRRYKSGGTDAPIARRVSDEDEDNNNNSEEQQKISTVFAKGRTAEVRAKFQRGFAGEKSAEEDDDVVVADDDDDDDDDDDEEETNESEEEDVEEIDADEDDDGVEISTSEGSEEGSEVVDDSKDEEDDEDEEEEEDDGEGEGEGEGDEEEEEEEADNEDNASPSEEEKEDDGKLKVKVSERDDKDERDVTDDEDEDSDGDDEDDDDEDEDEDEDEEEEEEIVPKIPPKLRKFEKVRLADKSKVKSAEASLITKPVKVVVEKTVDIKVNATKVEKAKKVEVVEKVAKKAEVVEKVAKKAEVVEKVAKKAEVVEKVAKKTDDDDEKLAKKDVGKVTKAKKIETEEADAKVKDSAPKAPVKSQTPKSATTKETTKAEVTKNEKSAVPKTKEKSEVKKTAKESTEKPKTKRDAEAKPDVTKKAGSGATNKKGQSKSSAAKRTEASISLTELNEAIHWVPTFVPNFTVVEDPVCQQHGKIFLRQLRGHKLWALQMLDASAKIPSGLLRGNINQLGDFDQCLGITARVKVDEKTVKIQGKYCLATLDLHATIPDMKVPVNFMQSRGFIRGSMRDPGHFIPRFTTANWALCIPAACSADDARSAIESGLSHLNVTSGMRFNVNVDPEMCYVRQKGQTYSKETIAVIYFYAMITCLVLVATIRDYLISPQGKGNFSERIIMSFSLRRTLSILTREGRSDAGEISCVNGIRSLATIALYVAHKMIPTAQMPYANRITLTEVANNPISSVLRASLVYTDCFLLLSGLLTAFNMARERSKRGEIRWFCRFVARFIRLTPALLVTLFWYAYVMEHTGSGPQWNSVIATNAELCKQNSWTNILYIQNFFPFEEMCATHTHQLALDMQLSLLAPVLIFFLTFKPIIGILVVFLLLQVAATLRYFATTNNYLSLVIFHGISVKHLYKTANLTYTLPLHRASSYIFGVGLGALLHYTGKNVRIYKIFVILGWLIATALASWSLFSPWEMARRDYTYNVEDAAQYAVISPVTWSLALCWIIFACYTDHGGFLNKFLSHYWMVLFSRISYAVYLCQFAIFFYNVGTTRYSSEFQVHRLVDPYEAAVVIFVSVVLTLFVDIPMQELKNVIMECTDTPPVAIDDRGEKSEPKEATITESNVGFGDGDDDQENEEKEWDWERSESRMSVEEDGLLERRRRSQSSQRTLIPEPDNGVHDLSSYQYREDDFRRDRRSASRQSDRILRHEEPVSLRKLPASRASEPKMLYPEMEDSISRYDSRSHFEQERTRAQSCEPVRHERPRHSSIPRREPPRLLSSGSEDESVHYQQQQQQHHHHKPTKTARRQPVEPKVSDEEDWEQELRIRRRRFMERLASESRSNSQVDESNDGWDGVKRRSSAEGKLALLKDSTESSAMDSWTVSRGRKLQPGSSQETEDDSAELLSHRDYYDDRRGLSREEGSEEESSAERSARRSLASGSQVTSLEDEEDVENNDFVLKKESRKISVMDLSQLSQEESEEERSFRWNVVKDEDAANKEEEPKTATLKLFKRESIVKSQASEEDPEYVLPERPKLLEQEQDHPFKKAWQLQKSRSEEDPTAYALKEIKTQADTSRSRGAASEEVKEPRIIKQSSSTEVILETHHDDVDDLESK